MQCQGSLNSSCPTAGSCHVTLSFTWHIAQAPHLKPRFIEVAAGCASAHGAAADACSRARANAEYTRETAGLEAATGCPPPAAPPPLASVTPAATPAPVALPGSAGTNACAAVSGTAPCGTAGTGAGGAVGARVWGTPLYAPAAPVCLAPPFAAAAALAALFLALTLSSTCFSVSATSCMVGRFMGSCSQQRCTSPISSPLSGRGGSTSSGLGSSRRLPSQTLTVALAATTLGSTGMYAPQSDCADEGPSSCHGTRSVSTSQSTTPKLYTSLEKPYASPRSSSGLCQAGLLASEPLCMMVSSEEGMQRLRLKSQTLDTNVPGSLP
mmetsp:Transcript_19963/g.43448  ORF Transcript_19963/g.43448 Transcript_19963/m.43448 type:complete len:325 (+) Transcript_19963:427-1401(+)